MNLSHSATLVVQASDATIPEWREGLECLLAHCPPEALAFRFACREAPTLVSYLLGRLVPDGLAPYYALLPGNVERFWWTSPGPPVAVWDAPARVDDASLGRLVCHDLPLETEYVVWLRDAAVAAGWWEALLPLLQQHIDCVGRPARADYSPEQVEWIRAQPWYRGVPFAAHKGRPGGCPVTGGLVALRAACLREADFPPGPPPCGRCWWAEPDGSDLLLGEMAHQLGWSRAAYELPRRLAKAG
jgi:hypothetical protein